MGNTHISIQPLPPKKICQDAKKDIKIISYTEVCKIYLISFSDERERKTERERFTHKCMEEIK